MIKSRREFETEHGAVLIWMALMMTVLLGAGALAVDLGYGYTVKRQLSSTADAAALAGAQEAGLLFKELGGCDGVGETELNDAITAAVTATHNANSPSGVSSPPTPTITCSDERVSVEVTERSSLRTFLGGVLGVQTLSPVASATAEVFGSEEQSGLRPFTVCSGDAFSARQAYEDPATRGGVYLTMYGNHNGNPVGCLPTGVPGNWGYASFMLGANGGMSTGVFKCLAEYGYGWPDSSCAGDATVDIGSIGQWDPNVDLTPPLPLDTDWTTGDTDLAGTPAQGDTGNNLQVTPEWRAILERLRNGPAFLIPVASYWEKGPFPQGDPANGWQSKYQGYGGMAIKLRGWIEAKPNGDIKDKQYSPECFVPSLPDNRTCDEKYLAAIPDWSDVTIALLWEFTGQYVGSGQGQDPTSACSLEDCWGVVTLKR